MAVKPGERQGCNDQPNDLTVERYAPPDVGDRRGKRRERVLRDALFRCALNHLTSFSPSLERVLLLGFLLSPSVRLRPPLFLLPTAASTSARPSRGTLVGRPPHTSACR